MRAIINFLGVVLILFGISVLVYRGFSYQDKDTIAKIGDLEVTAMTQKYIYLSPVYGGIALLAGAILLVAGNRKR